MMTSSASDDLLFIGVDGGGSRCRVRVRDRHGVLRGSIDGGTANVYLDFDTALGNIRACLLASVAPFAAGSTPTTLRLGLGLAGVSGSRMAERVQAVLSDLGTVTVTNDGDVACIGAHAGGDGGLVIAGTGSGGVARIAGRAVTIGGRGFIMGDDGSGARLGLEALRRAVRAADGLEPATPLTSRLMARFDNDPVAVIEWARTARSSDFGSLAPLVLEFARENDPVAHFLVVQSAAAIAELGEVLTRLGAPRLSLAGGLSAALLPFFTTAIAWRDPLFDALDGALILAGCPLPGVVAWPGGGGPA